MKLLTVLTTVAVMSFLAFAILCRAPSFFIVG